MALVAPTLCPRCDAPAVAADPGVTVDQCEQCSLQLRWCGNCHGVAGPFDHFCGFCGFELIRGQRRNPLWRLWVLVALVPLTAGLGYGLWMAHAPAQVARVVRAATAKPTPASGGLTGYASRGLELRYLAPSAWTVVDYSAGQQTEPTIVVSQQTADQRPAADAKGDLSQVGVAQSTVVTLGRPPAGTGVVADPRDPVAALAAEVAPLVAAPPAGTTVQVFQPVHAVSVTGHPAAEVVLKLTRGSDVWYLRRDLVYAPHGAAAPVFRVDALSPSAQWPAVNDTAVTPMVRSLTFS